MIRVTKRSGFTLLETLISLGLVTTLMLLSWSLFATFSRLELRSRKQVAGLEIARTLNRQLRSDLDQLVQIQMEYDRAGPEGNTSLDSLTDDLVNQASSESLRFPKLAPQTGVESIDDQVFVSPFFEGGSDSISFLVPSRSGTGIRQTKKWQVVSYEWHDPSIFEKSSRTSSSDETDDLLQNENQVSGTGFQTANVFARRVSDFSEFKRRQSSSNDSVFQDSLDGLETIEIGRTQSKTESMAESSAEIVDEIPEIEEISFRYFDGSSWTNSFSSSSGNYPQAIEVVFQIRRERGKASNSKNDDDQVEVGEELIVGVGKDELNFESAASMDPDELSVNSSFKPGDQRFLIFLGTERKRQSPRTKNQPGFLDFEFPGVER